MEPDEKETARTGLLDRFRKSWFPPAAVVGAMAGIVAAAYRGHTGPQPTLKPPAPPDAAEPSPEKAAAQPPAGLDLEYARTAVIGGKESLHPFRRSLAGITIGTGDVLYALGDGEVRLFGPDGSFIRSWKAVQDATCLAAAPDGRVIIGAPGRVEFYDAEGRHTGGFPAGDKDRLAAVTEVKVSGMEILVADAAARIIRRYDATGRQLGLIGSATKTRNFILPNKWLDFDVDAKGVVRAADNGRHRVSAWAPDGTQLGWFGKFGMKQPEDFVGCCNPVNVAIAPDGKVVTGEKMVARVKVFEPEGKLLAVIGPENFDANCIHIHLAVDSKGRILAADPVRREVQVFSPVVKVGVNEPFCRETSSDCVGAGMARQYTPLAAMARETAGVELRFSYYRIEEELVAAAARGEVDGMIAKTWAVLRAYGSADGGCRRVCDVPFPDGDPDLRGVFVARADGPIRSLQDLDGRKLAVGKPESYENSHAADLALRKSGVEPGVKREYGGCIPAAVSVLDGEADAAVVSNYCTRFGLEAIVGTPGTFRTIGETDPIPFATFALSARLSPEFRSRLQEALLQPAKPGTVVEKFAGGLRPPAEWSPKEVERT